MLSFACFIATANKDIQSRVFRFLIGRKLISRRLRKVLCNHVIQFGHEYGARRDRRCIPNVSCGLFKNLPRNLILICRLVSALALLLQLGNRCDTIKCNNDSLLRINNANVILDFCNHLLNNG